MEKKAKSTSVVRGDGLRLSLEKNTRTLEVIGDGCRVRVTENVGRIRMIGDGGRLEVLGRNAGDIEYRGDGGRVVLGSGATLRSVLYVGDDGRVGKSTKKVEVSEKSRGVGVRTTFTLKKSAYTPD